MHSSSPSMVMEFSIGEEGNLDDQLSQLPTVGKNQRKPLILYSYAYTLDYSCTYPYYLNTKTNRVHLLSFHVT